MLCRKALMCESMCLKSWIASSFCSRWFLNVCSLVLWLSCRAHWVHDLQIAVRFLLLSAWRHGFVILFVSVVDYSLLVCLLVLCAESKATVLLQWSVVVVAETWCCLGRWRNAFTMASLCLNFCAHEEDREIWTFLWRKTGVKPWLFSDSRLFCGPLFFGTLSATEDILETSMAEIMRGGDHKCLTK